MTVPPGAGIDLEFDSDSKYLLYQFFITAVYSRCTDRYCQIANCDINAVYSRWYMAHPGEY